MDLRLGKLGKAFLGGVLVLAIPWPDGQQYRQAPVLIGEFGTGNSGDDLNSSGAGSQGQWFTDIVNFIQSSYAVTDSNDPGVAVESLHWTPIGPLTARTATPCSKRTTAGWPTPTS